MGNQNAQDLGADLRLDLLEDGKGREDGERNCQERHQGKQRRVAERGGDAQAVILPEPPQDEGGEGQPVPQALFPPLMHRLSPLARLPKFSCL